MVFGNSEQFFNFDTAMRLNKELYRNEMLERYGMVVSFLIIIMH